MTDSKHEPGADAARIALLESELRFRNLADNLPGAVFRYVLRADGTDQVEFMSRGCLEIWEVEPAEVQHSAALLWDVIVAEDVPAMHASIERSAQTLTRWSHLWRIRPKSGQVKWLQGYGTPRRLPNDDIEWDSVILDVSDRARAEEALARTLREHQAITESITDNLFMVDLQGRLLWWNRRVEEVLGLTAAELRDQDAAAFFAPEDRPVVAAALRQAAEQGYGEFEARLQTRHGPVFYQYSGVALRDSTQRLAGGAGSGRDISERRRIEATLRSLNEELERRVEQRTAELAAAKREAERVSSSKSEFMSRLSHELRTPMSAVLGFTQLLLGGKGGALNESQRDYVAKVKRAGEHVLELLNEVLDLARIEAGRIEMDVQAVPLAPLVAEVVGLTQPIAEARGIALTVSAEGSANIRVSADPKRLRQVLLNLLSNAIKYNFAGGRVTVGWVVDHGRARISVADTGPGIAPLQQVRLFQPFERLDADHGADGTGIGLAITKRLVELMDGEIGVSSRVGEGSTFWVRLTALPTQF